MKEQLWMWIDESDPLVEELKGELEYAGDSQRSSDYICLKLEVGLSELVQELIK